MRKASDPIGPYNDTAILDGANWSDVTICAWGTHGEHLQRGGQVADLLRQTSSPLFHLGLSKAGHPKHPLYIAYTQSPQPWVQADPDADN